MVTQNTPPSTPIRACSRKGKILGPTDFHTFGTPPAPRHGPMRILHVSHELPPYELAGTAIYTWHIAKAQAANHEVFVFSRLQDPHVEPYRVHDEVRDGCRIRFVNRADLEWSPLDHSYEDPKMRGIFANFLDETKPEVVHFQHVVGLGAGVIEEARSRGITVVMTLHDFWAMCPMGQRMCYSDWSICDPINFAKCGPCVFGAGHPDAHADAPLYIEPTPPPKVEAPFEERRALHYQARVAATPGRIARRPRAWAESWVEAANDAIWGGGASTSVAETNPFVVRYRRMQQVLGLTDLLITPSAFLRDEFVKHFGVPRSKIVHSSNGMDFSYVERLAKTPSPKLRIGFVGSIIKTKGVHTLVDGFLAAAAGRNDLELHVHGAPNRWSGDYLDDLKRRAASNPNVVFHGRFDNRRIGTVLQNIDVLVLPSIWFENAPLTLNEAAMSGTPILVSDRGGMLEFVKANNYGWTFTLGDPKDLASKIRMLADDRSLVPKLAGAPPKIKPVSANAEELLVVYRRLLDKSWKTPVTTAVGPADTFVVR